MGNKNEKNVEEMPGFGAKQDEVQLVPDKSLTFGNIGFIGQEARHSKASRRKPRV